MKVSKEHQWRVGVFVFVGSILLGASIFFLGGADLFKAQAKYRARFPQSQGLQIGSVVSLTGINIGNITSIDLLPNENIVEVTMNVEANFSSHITEGSEADIRTQGALGDKYIFIKPGPANNKPLPSNSLIPMTPAVDLISMISEKGEQAGRIFDILNDLHKITQSLTKENQVGKLMASSESAMIQFRKTFEEAEKLVRDVRGGSTNNVSNEPSQVSKSIQHLELILKRLEKGEGTLGALLTDNSLHEKLKSILGTDAKSQAIRSVLRNSLDQNVEPKK